VRNSYDLIAERWHASRAEGAAVGRLLRYVDMVAEGLRPGARVLDVGCGTGRPVAEHLIGRGYRVVGVDQSAGMLEIARRVVPEAELIHGDMLEAEFGGGFSAAVAWDSIFHVERARHEALFRKLAAALEPGGRLLLSTGADGDEGFTSEMYGQSFFYSGHEPEVARGLLESVGFEIERWEVDDPSSRGHVAVVARRAA
jgi:SAM-dependent methyltransferase